MIVGKIWKKNFPNWNLTAQEAGLLEGFRDGLAPGLWSAFKTFYAKARNDWLVSKRTRSRQSEAVHMIQAAGALARPAPYAAASALLQALSTDPAWTAKTLFQRFSRAGHLR